MNKITYIYNDFVFHACRDGLTEEFCTQLGFTPYKFSDWLLYVGLPSNNIIVEASAIDCEAYYNILSSIIKCLHDNKFNFVVRRIDNNLSQFTEWDWKVLELIKYYNCRLIAPYYDKYFGEIDPIVIPYHYEESDEQLIGYEGRVSKAILSGANFSGPDMYPIRNKLYEDIDNHPNMETIKHCGYSGKAYGKPGIYTGSDYIRKMSEYIAMIVTTSNNKCLLLKYVECAEAGCIPIGDNPNWGLSVMIPTITDDYNDILSIIDSIDNIDPYTYQLHASNYRKFIKDNFNKDMIINMYKTLFDEE